MKRSLKILALILPLCLVLTACAATEPERDESKLQIVCSDFPAYDFARAVAGDRAQIKLLLKPGAEVHSYEPAPKDVVAIEESDLFIYNGGESEEWVETLVGEQVRALRMMDCVEPVEESSEGIYAAEAEDEDETELDEHVWTSPKNASVICRAICDELCAVDPDGAGEYTSNFDAYNAQLTEIDAEIRETVQNAMRDTLVFADRFPMRYFTREYGLKYYAAYPGCASQTEPSAKTVAFLIDHVREENIPAVLYMEFSNEKMADVICEDTGCKKLPFYSAHSVTARQFTDGVTYIDLMRMNILTLKEALY